MANGFVVLDFEDSYTRLIGKLNDWGEFIDQVKAANPGFKAGRSWLSRENPDR